MDRNCFGCTAHRVSRRNGWRLVLLSFSPPSRNWRFGSRPAPNTPASATTISISTSSMVSRGAKEIEIIPLGEETVTPLCTPDIAKRIRKPKDLFGQVLIRSDVKRVQWHQWFAANGLESPAIHGMRFDRSFLAIAMASSGLGVTLESTRLAEREIATGKLVAPLDGRSVDVRYVGHYLVFPRASRQRRAVRAFVEWITSELSATEGKSKKRSAVDR